MVVLLILLSLGAVVVVLSASPIVFSFELNYPGGGANLTIRWLWGLARFRPGAGGRKKKAKESRKSKRRGEQKGTKRIENPKAFLAPRVRRAALRVVARLFRRIEVRRLSLRLVIGLDDPADTAFVYGALLPIGLLLNALPAGEFRIDPRFEEEVVEIVGAGAVGLIPFMVVATALGTFLRRDGWIILRAVKDAKWNTKKR
jgi:hypothetical protein